MEKKPTKTHKCQMQQKVQKIFWPRAEIQPCPATEGRKILSTIASGNIPKKKSDS